MGASANKSCCGSIKEDNEVDLSQVTSYSADDMPTEEEKLALSRKSVGSEADAAASEAEDKRRQEEMKSKAGQRRAGVAAESVSNDKIQNYVKPVYEKDQASREKIAETLRTNPKMAVLFGHLEGAALDDVINAFQAVKFKEGDFIIRQGDEGDALFICADGSVDVFVKRQETEELGDKVVTLGAGALFGELALMYQAPRAASVRIASAACTCWSLDREPFKMLLAQSGQTKLEIYEGFLKEVELLKSLNHFELAKLSDCLESRLYDSNEEIIKQGENGIDFFIVEDGTCAAFISGPDGEKEVKTYKEGGYFGEIALLKDEPRRATVKATGEGASVLVCSKEDFVNLLGPVQDILKREIDKYPQYAEFLKG
jgi:cAMP-dependent protein kinase regulator